LTIHRFSAKEIRGCKAAAWPKYVTKVSNSRVKLAEASFPSLNFRGSILWFGGRQKGSSGVARGLVKGMEQRETGRPNSDVALTIAGFDPSSGAGVTADLAVFAAHGWFGTSCITALTVQSTLGVERVKAVDSAIVAETLDSLERDLAPVGIKIGMLDNGRNVAAVMRYLEGVHRRIPVVLDPVVRSSSGVELIDSEGIKMLRAGSLQKSSWATPNLHELAILLEKPLLQGRTATEIGARELAERNGLSGVVVTNGEAASPADYVWSRDHGDSWLEGEHIKTRATHGTGCAFSSALLCGLMEGLPGPLAASKAKTYVTEALRRAVPRGAGRGPMALLWPLQR
jgi:hydroxymethylpyrimidine/phosphomethylpyrimidine kinase